MGWNAHLTDDRGHEEGCWSYTHNTNGMIAAALVLAGEPEPEMCVGPLGKAIGPSWWDRLNGATGADGAAYLNAILTGLAKDPAGFEAMNPANGWGDYHSLVEVLTRMRSAVPEWPTTWEVGG